MLIWGKWKINYLDGSIQSPPTMIHNNSLVMLWLIHSMDIRIGELCLLYPTAKAIWDLFHVAYSVFEDSSQMFSLRTRARNLHQDQESDTTYFHSLTRLWQERDLFQQKKWNDLVDADIYC